MVRKIINKNVNIKGILSMDELVEAYMVVFNDREKAKEEVEKILQIIDFNQSGQVDFTGIINIIILIEFLMAAMN